MRVALLVTVAGILTAFWLLAASRARYGRKIVDDWADGIVNIWPKAVALTEEDEWVEAHERAKLAERFYPRDDRVRGITQEVRRLAELELGKRSGEVDALIRAQDYEGAKARATELTLWGMRLPFAELTQAAGAKQKSFAENCWADVMTVLEESYVYTRDDSVACLERYLARFGESPHAEAGREMLAELGRESDGYFVEKRLSAAGRAVRQMDWREAEQILAGAAAAVEAAGGGDEVQWLEKFAGVQRELDAVMRRSTADRLGILRVFEGQSGSVRSITFRPRSAPLQVAAACQNNEVTIWDSAAGEVLQSLTLPAGVRRVAFSPDGALLAAGCEDGTIHLWHLDEKTSSNWRSGHDARLQSLCFSSDGRTLLSASSDAVRLWDVSGSEAAEAGTLPRAQAPAAFSGTGRLVAAKAGEHIRIWDEAGPEAASRPLTCTTPVTMLTVSPDGRLLAAGHEDKTITVWDVEEGTLLLDLSGHGRNLVALAFSADSHILASAATDKKIILWNMTARHGTDERLIELPEHPRRINALAFSPDGKLLASGSTDMAVRLWGVITQGQAEESPQD